ncbi:MAG TPA: hypothetical protein VEF33_02030 [Syntrophales bacterium]|nr:hypothetical protein [Syntrophales bacterium]
MRRHYREVTILSRKTWKNYRKYIIYMVFVLLGACASLPTPPDKPTPVFEQGWFKKSPSDADIFSKGMFYLGDREKAVDYVKARGAFDELLKKYPRSKWRGLSEILIRLIDVTQLSEKAKEENAKLRKENEQIKKDNKQLLEEMAKLVQENEQLKKDIELLKSLEVQLEKREKMLR